MPWPHACPSFHNESQYVKSFEKLIALEPNECGDQEKIDHGGHDPPDMNRRAVATKTHGSKGLYRSGLVYEEVPHFDFKMQIGQG